MNEKEINEILSYKLSPEFLNLEAKEAQNTADQFIESKQFHQDLILFSIFGGDERKEVLESFVTRLAEITGMEKPELVYDQDKSQDFKYRRPSYGAHEPGKIHMPKNMDELLDPLIALKTIAHEYLGHEVEATKHYSGPRPQADIDVIDKQINGYKVYMPSATDYEVYKNQPVEVHANRVAAAFIERVLERAKSINVELEPIGDEDDDKPENLYDCLTGSNFYQSVFNDNGKENLAEIFSKEIQFRDKQNRINIFEQLYPEAPEIVIMQNELIADIEKESERRQEFKSVTKPKEAEAVIEKACNAKLINWEDELVGQIIESYMYDTTFDAKASLIKGKPIDELMAKPFDLGPDMEDDMEPGSHIEYIRASSVNKFSKQADLI